MSVPDLFLYAVAALLALAAAWDLTSFTIPNFLSLILIGLFAVFAVVVGMPAAAVGWHALAGAAALVAGFALFAFGYIGGGDAKLFAAIGLWVGFSRSFGSEPYGVIEFAAIASLIGGVFALLLMSVRSFPLPAMLSGQSWLTRLHDAGSGVPYGVALAAGALVVLPHTDVFRLATT
jgi:prepilin peptidase CpaA